MSQQASSIGPVTVGNTARALNVPLTDPGKPATPAIKKSRTPLSLVVSAPRRSRNQLMIILFMVVVAALSVVLVMSISVSKGQYELVGLKSQQTQLLKTNQNLEQEIAAKQAPQELVAQAAALGMVPASTTGQIDVRTQKVSGTPQPAKADTKGLIAIPPAAIDKPQPVVEESAPEVPLSPAAKTQANESVKAQAKPDAAVPATPVAKTPDLHGGTIPAPAQRDS